MKMSYETKKASKRRKKIQMFRERIFVGKGIDIGCGKDILNRRIFQKITLIKPFDIENGDAQYINKFEPENSYDFVHSSNCLEHMNDPLIAIKNWFSIVKERGYLIFTVPDEDLYEQGFFPSKYNYDHKWTFTIYKQKSWCSKSINILDFLMGLKNCKIITIGIIDTNYDYAKKNEDQTRGEAEAFIEVVIQKVKSFKN
jgi:SAM-dependent methyltransferase